MKIKLIFAAVLSTLILCSCSENTSGEAEITESFTTAVQTVSQTESMTVSKTEETVETETTVKTSSEVIPDILELSIDHETIPGIMPEDMEFTLDLKDITPETDLFALTNMKKHNVGETFTIDLDCDGTEEKISVKEYFYNNESVRILSVIIDKNTYNIDISYTFMNEPTGIFICDIDSSDDYIEIACANSIPTNDYLTSFYRYENGELEHIFKIFYDTPDGRGENEMFFDKMNASVTGKPIIIDGSGVITAARRLDSQTWLAYSHYLYDSESGAISLVCEPVYPYYYENIDNYDMAMEFASEYYEIVPDRPLSKSLQEITLYKEHDTNSETLTLAPQRIYFTAECPYPVENPAAYGNGLGLWTYIVAEDGTTGWVRSYLHRLTEENDNDYFYDVFGGLVLYD